MTISLLTRGYISRAAKILQQVPLTPSDGQSILAQSLELPLPPSLTKAIGIHQSDVIIRSAIQVALADLRANPWLLDYVFASLPQDPVTWKEYGEKSVQAAKDWFLKTNIPVVITPVIDESSWPKITLTLVESSEAINETTLGDVHSEPIESNDSQWPAIVTNYTPKSYIPVSGLVSWANPPPAPNRLAPGMFIIDHVGRAHEILEVLDNQTVLIAQGTVADFRNATIKGHRPAFVTTIESASYREVYRVGVHVPAEPATLTWLHSIVVFCLLRYKEALLEARGYERSVLQSSDFVREEQFDTELIFSRYVTVSGYVRQYWPKMISRTIDSIDLETIKVDEAGTIKDAGVDPNTQLWTGDDDDVDPSKR